MFNSSSYLECYTLPVSNDMAAGVWCNLDLLTQQWNDDWWPLTIFHWRSNDFGNSRIGLKSCSVKAAERNSSTNDFTLMLRYQVACWNQKSSDGVSAPASCQDGWSLCSGYGECGHSANSEVYKRGLTTGSNYQNGNCWHPSHHSQRPASVIKQRWTRVPQVILHWSPRWEQQRVYAIARKMRTSLHLVAVTLNFLQLTHQSYGFRNLQLLWQPNAWCELSLSFRHCSVNNAAGGHCWMPF